MPYRDDVSLWHPCRRNRERKSPQKYVYASYSNRRRVGVLLCGQMDFFQSEWLAGSLDFDRSCDYTSDLDRAGILRISGRNEQSVHP